MSEIFSKYGFPRKHGLYDPANEKDACGVGFVANIKGVRSHQIITDAETILRNMDHRGACGCEYNTGDGAGILTGMPHEFMQKVVKADLRQDLPEPGRYAVGIVFLPQDERQRKLCIAIFARYIEAQGQRLLGWRQVPTDSDKANVGPIALQSEPNTQQVVIAAADGITDDEFERQIYLIRKQATLEIRSNDSMDQAKMFYVNSLSPKVHCL